ncbi:hypothetical protein LIER_27200 [Lithospermum erythrorhizon]|uniref:Uncharacterized protein n=1 Tax=Lithospermum erythrorhizon TaxID=34254 RepID=A0AAV3RH25_LITER
MTPRQLLPESQSSTLLYCYKGSQNKISHPETEFISNPNQQKTHWMISTQGHNVKKQAYSGTSKVGSCKEGGVPLSLCAIHQIKIALEIPGRSKGK